MIPKEILSQIRKIEIRSGKLVNEIFAGQYSSVFKGRGMEFAEVREYAVGDDVRSIDWNVTARMGHPFVKKFVEAFLRYLRRQYVFKPQRDVAVLAAVLRHLLDVDFVHRYGGLPFTDELFY